jgi:predicted amidohydrolase YtcJ
MKSATLAIATVLAAPMTMPATPLVLAPDLLIVNAAVRTLDPARPQAEALAVYGHRIVAVGGTGELRALAGPNTRVIDAAGRSVLPGFNDAHVHWLSGGFALTNVDLRDAASPEEFARRIGDFAKTLPRGRWILGGDWDHEKFPGAPLPTRDWIDPVTPDHPVFVSRTDGHMALANSLALKLARIGKDTPDVPGGVIVRDAKGEPTGILKDAAMGLVEAVIPPRSWDEKLAAARAATEHAARLGVTSVQDMSADGDVGLYQFLLERGELKTRIYAVRSILSWETLAQAGVRAAFGNPWLRIGGLKGFADGSLGSSTALFFEPYADAPNTRGLLFDQMLPEGAMLRRVEAADRAGLQVMIHAIGDEANYRILELFREVAEKNGPRDRRFRIEHAQHLRPGEIPRFARQRVIASMQPYHAADDGRWCDKRIGPARSRYTYAFRSLLDAGATLAFGSDWTVAPLNPFEGLKAAVTRQTLDGKHPNGWVPEEKITLEEALRAYTVGSAVAEFQEHLKGTLTPGKLADFVLLDRDIFRTDPAELDRVNVWLTVVDGKIVWESPEMRAGRAR